MTKKREIGFPKIQLKGKGSFIPPSAKPLNISSNVNDYVGWHSDDDYQEGLIEKWDGNTAVINSNGKIYRVDCTNPLV